MIGSPTLFNRTLTLGYARARGGAPCAAEWVANACTDVTAGDSDDPYERLDGVKPVNKRYNALVGCLLGMTMPGIVRSVRVTIAAVSKSFSWVATQSLVQKGLVDTLGLEQLAKYPR